MRCAFVEKREKKRGEGERRSGGFIGAKARIPSDRRSGRPVRHEIMISLAGGPCAVLHDVAGDDFPAADGNRSAVWADIPLAAQHSGAQAVLGYAAWMGMRCYDGHGHGQDGTGRWPEGCAPPQPPGLASHVRLATPTLSGRPFWRQRHASAQAGSVDRPSISRSRSPATTQVRIARTLPCLGVMGICCSRGPSSAGLGGQDWPRSRPD